MNTSDLIDNLRKDFNLSRTMAKTIVQSVIERMGDALTEGDGKLTITNFGTFHVREIAARRIVDPNDPSRLMEIEAKPRIVFQASDSIKRKLEAKRGDAEANN